ncbi:MAG: hypothetical protein RI911_621 [Candidatus Parcubacteria bacterium]|jgi:hypothetical protein
MIKEEARAPAHLNYHYHQSEFFGEVYGLDWEKETQHFNTHGEFYLEITRTLYGSEEKNTDRFRSDQYIVEDIGKVYGVIMCVLIGEELVDTECGSNKVDGPQKRAALEVAHKALERAIIHANVLSNKNPPVHALLMKRIEEFREYIKKYAVA